MGSHHSNEQYGYTNDFRVAVCNSLLISLQLEVATAEAMFCADLWCEATFLGIAVQLRQRWLLVGQRIETRPPSVLKTPRGSWNI